MGGGRTYTQAEVDAILARAVERAEADKANLSLDELVQIGAELGIAKEVVLASAEEVSPDAAEETVGVSRFEPLAVRPQGGPSTAKAASPAAQIAAWRAEQKRKWIRGVIAYVVGNAFLAFINVATSPGKLWFLWCVVGWGMGLAISAIKVFFADDDTVQRLVHVRQARKKRRAARRERRQARRELRSEIRGEILQRVDDMVRQVLVGASHADAPRTRVRLKRAQVREDRAVGERASYGEDEDDKIEERGAENR